LQPAPGGPHGYDSDLGSEGVRALDPSTTRVEPRYPRVVLASVSVPWSADGSVIEDVFRRQIQVHLEAGIGHLYIFGTAGEGYAVTERQFDEISRIFVAEMAGPDAYPMIGLISHSMGTIIERIERSLDLGAHSFQFALPSWGTLNDRELETFFQEVLGRFPQASFVHYNLQRSGRLLDPSHYARLSADYPNLVGSKNGTSNIVLIHDLITKAPALRYFLTELGYPQGCQAGEPGLLMSLTTLNPALGRRFFEAGVSGDIATLTRIQAEALDVFAELVGGSGAEVGTNAFPGSAPHMDGAYEKMLSRVHDERLPLRLLPPYQAVSDEVYEDFVRRLAAKLPGWLPEGHPGHR